MKVARVRLLIAAALFAGWLGWLAYLVSYKNKPIIVSHSQVMASTNFVVAEVSVDPETGQPKREVNVVEDLRPVGDQLAGEIKVINIRDARIAGDGKFEDNTKYLLPLTRRATGEFELTPPPRAPGSESIRSLPWAYRWDDPEVQRQFNELVPKK